MKKKNQAKKLSPPKKDKPAAARHSSGWLPKKPLKKLAAAIQGHGQTAASLKPEGVLLAPRACIERSLQNLPTGYGDNLIYLMARDPYWIYAYWEIQKEHEESVLVSLGADRSSVKSVLRVYDVTEPAGKTSFFDITLRDML
ncbi:MAG: DUF4912 domain-containing protein, partial [Candidatus Omnitrophota bacterium]